jgi:adenine deaminase
MDRGLVAPGWRADLVILDSLEGCHAEMVFSAGRKVTEKLFETRKPVPPVGLNSVKAKPVSAASFATEARDGETPVIGILPGKIITEHRRFALPSRGGHAEPDLDRDIVKVAVVERHGENGNIAVGFVQGFGLKRGAIGSTVGHDCHNIGIVGVSDADMALAANRLREINGGFVVVADGAVLAEIALPVAGLMSLDDHVTVRTTLKRLREAALSLGTTLEEPFLQLAFLPLPVIPHLKITDRGLVDVDRFELIG